MAWIDEGRIKVKAKDGIKGQHNMKVAFLLGSLNRGGTETMILDIFKDNSDVRFAKLLVYREEGCLSNEFHSTEWPVYLIKPDKTLFALNYLFLLRKLIKNEKINIIHAHQRVDVLYAWFASLGLQIKIIQTIHDFDFKYNKTGIITIKLSLRLALGNIFVSNHQKYYYLSRYKPCKKHFQIVVYNGVNFDKFKTPELKLLQKEPIAENKPIQLGMVGNFNSVRDHFTICRFLKLLASQDIEFRFTFVGGKDTGNPQIFDKCYLYCQENGLSEKVVFTGVRSDIPVFLSKLDAFIYSSDHDTFGIAVIEAIAAGIPVFTNDWAVMKEITEDGKRAILYKTGDEIDLLSKFLRFCRNPLPYVKNASENAIWAKNSYNILKHINALNEVYLR
ncbi:MAG TPA: glycosyltransferase [Bacteroidales bacterium]|jgi:glycosyltransferase involved in cell wall biosynthesis|nr:glycosyltransferase [Bacteroidales bacterium]HQJ21073.1 glycosyltransferase [Bacteroidales bacterium]